MSRNDWERGTIKIPSNQWSAFKKALINHFNSQAETNYNLSITIYEKLLETSKHKRNYDYYQAITELLSLNAVRHGRWEDRKIHNSLLPLNASGKPKKPKAKETKTFKPATPPATAKPSFFPPPIAGAR